MNIKSNPVITILIATAVAVISMFIILGFTSFALVVAGVVVIMCVGELAILYFLKRDVLKRKQNIFAQITIVFIGITLITAVADMKYGTLSMPGWTSVLGLLLLFSGNYIMITALFAVSRHGEQEYGEKPEAEKTVMSVHGPYDVIRHPNNLAGFLVAVSIPLILSSVFAFIPAFLAVVFIIVQAVTIENYRFEHYTWYYDYTKKVPYMIFPVIW